MADLAFPMVYYVPLLLFAHQRLYTEREKLLNYNNDLKLSSIHLKESVEQFLQETDPTQG